MFVSVIQLIIECRMHMVCVVIADCTDFFSKMTLMMTVQIYAVLTSTCSWLLCD